MKIAIVGAGISGLTCAHYLSRRHSVTVFEAERRIGGHVRTVRVRSSAGESAIDMGFVVFHRTNYPLFTRLLEELRVEARPTAMSFSVRSDRSGIEFNGASVSGLFCQRRNLIRPRFLRILGDIARFQIEGPAQLRSGGDGQTVADFLAEGGYGPGFADEYLGPLGSALWSVPVGSFRDFPLRFVVEFLENHGMLRWSRRPPWLVIRGGSQRYVDRLCQPFADRIRCRTKVVAVQRRNDSVRIVDSTGSAGSFRRAILACHADQALGMLSEPTALESAVLGAFPYQANEAWLHTDPEPLPRRKSAWASWNYRIRRRSQRRAAVTYNMNSLQSLPWDRLYNVTLNDFDGIDSRRVLERQRFTHPVFSPGRTAAQARHDTLNSSGPIAYCGAYWGYGFHEDGVRSAIAACRSVDPESGP